MKSINYFILFTLFFISISCKQQDEEYINTETPYVILVSLDGFKWDYTNHAETPFLDSLEIIGTKAESLMPCFPTKTFPNHYSIVTGLYPAHHGLINNSFYDSNSDRFYRINDRTAVCDGYFYSGEPIWNTASKQNINTASFYWVGSEANIQGMHPDIWKVYDHDFPYQARIDTVISWLKKPISKRPKLITLYFNQPDNYGHKYGPEDSRTLNMVERMDAYMQNLYHQLQLLPFKDSINLIITSDHGMTTIDSTRSIVLSDYLKEEWIDKIVGGNPIYNIKAKEGYADTLLHTLNNVPHLITWGKDNIPDSFNYKNNDRILDVVTCAEIGWGLYPKSPKHYSNGTHGYSPDYKDMHTIFYAVGPNFKEGYVSPTFRNIDIYNLICYILEINPAKNDGDFGRIQKLLK